MIIETLLFIYSLILTSILIFLLPQTIKYRKWYLKLLIDSKSNFRTERFFKEMNSIFKKFYPYLESLKQKRGRKPTDYCFQFRWLIWWRFFGSYILQKALREYNESEFLKKLLDGPAYEYTREQFHNFRKKLSPDIIEQWGTELILEIVNKNTSILKTIIMDSFPIKSYLNTQKCLKAPKIEFLDLKKFIDSLKLDDIIKLINNSPKMYSKIKTKLIVLLVKETWDLSSWNRAWKELTGNKAKEVGISLPYPYKSISAVKSIEEDLKRIVKGKSIELYLLEKLTPIIKNLVKKPPNFKLKTLSDLNFTWHKPHRARDPGISMYYCATKDENRFGRGGIILVSRLLEIPLLIINTPKYKQGTESILNSIDKIKISFGKLFESSKLLADSEFGISDVLEALKAKITKFLAIPNYGASEEKNNLSKQDRDDRKTVERVLARLESNWHLEKPRHLGDEYVSFHVKLIRLCDILQILFNTKIDNTLHPHAFIPFRG